jgi:pimeloyl-ACP methyl ester carboxylesterase
MVRERPAAQTADMTQDVARAVRAVPVPGGDLAVELLAGRTDPVLALHGVSSNRRLWSWLRAEAPEISLLAPDLRGRGDSIAVTGRSSLARHVEDAVAVLDAYGLDAVHVCGMSMGGFVAVQLAVTHPERVLGLVLVDGGLPMTPPPGLTPEALPAVFADRLARLGQTWDSVEAYRDHFVASTCPLLDPQDPLLLDYLAHDLRDGRVRLSADALVADATDVFFAPPPLDRVEVPVRLLHAEWGAGPGTPPAYDAAAVDAVRDRLAGVRYVPGVDHGASIMSPAGAKASAELLREALR